MGSVWNGDKLAFIAKTMSNDQTSIQGGEWGGKMGE